MASGSEKNRTSEERNVSEIQEATSASVHGVLIDVSPVKKSRKNEAVPYFHGEISDGRFQNDFI